MEEAKNYISIQEATQYCNYSQDYLSLRARQGKLKAVKIGRNWLTKKEWVEDYVARTEEYKNNLSATNGRIVGEENKRTVLPISKFGEQFSDFHSISVQAPPPENLPFEVLKIKNVVSLKDKFLNLTKVPSFQFAFYFSFAVLFLFSAIVFEKDSFDSVSKDVKNIEVAVLQGAEIVNEATVGRLEKNENYLSAAKIFGEFKNWGLDKFNDSKFGISLNNYFSFSKNKFTKAEDFSANVFSKNILTAKNIFAKPVKLFSFVKTFLAGSLKEGLGVAWNIFSNAEKFVLSPWNQIPSNVFVIDKSTELEKIQKEIAALKKKSGVSGLLTECPLGPSGPRGPEGPSGPVGPSGPSGQSGVFSFNETISNPNVAFSGNYEDLNVNRGKFTVGPSGNIYTAGALSLDSGNITSSSGSLSFDNENLTTSGNLTVKDITSSGNLSTGSISSSNLSILSTASPQLTLSYQDGVSASLSVDADGDLAIATTGGSITLGDSVIGESINIPGQGVFRNSPTLAHAFPVWAAGAANSNVSNSTVYINPSTNVADSNLLGLAVNGSVKFLVDSEGDIFANGLTTTGAVNVGETTISTLTVENNSTLGDASTDQITFNAATLNIPNNLTFSGGNLSILGVTSASNMTATNLTVSGNVGIGTSSPGVKMQVVGQSGTGNIGVINITGYDSFGQSLVMQLPSAGYTGNLIALMKAAGGSGQAMGFSTHFTADVADRFSIMNHSGVENLVVLDGGNVGIGTTSPGKMLDVNGDIRILADNGFYFGTSGTIIGNNAGRMQLITNNTEKVSILTTGNVGIGTTSPVTKLHVIGNGVFTTGLGVGTANIGGGTGESILSIVSSSTAPTAAVGISHLYTNSAGEGYWMDAAGNTTLQTPHDAVTGEWIFNSTNSITGKTLRVNMEQMSKFIDETFGTDFVFDSSVLAVESEQESDGVLGWFGQKVKDVLNGLGMAIDNGVATVKGLFAEKVTTNELCVGDTCIDEEGLKQLLQKAGDSAESLNIPDSILKTESPADGETVQ